MIDSQAADPHVHALCIRLAHRCLAVIRGRGLLRGEDEAHLALGEFYRAALIELDKLETI